MKGVIAASGLRTPPPTRRARRTQFMGFVVGVLLPLLTSGRAAAGDWIPELGGLRDAAERVGPAILGRRAELPAPPKRGHVPSCYGAARPGEIALDPYAEAERIIAPMVKHLLGFSGAKPPVCFVVASDDEADAFMFMGSGELWITAGLIKNMQNDSQLAAMPFT